MKKIILISLLFTVYSQAELRTWLTSTGTEIKASFDQFKSGNVSLKSESGKKATMKVSELSVVDRLYLLDKEGVAEDDVLDGYKKDHEKRLKLDSNSFKKDGTISLAANGEELEFTIYSTPHFEIWAEDKINSKNIGAMMEQARFYNAWRTPQFLEYKGSVKDLLIVTNSEEGIRHILKYYTNENPSLTTRQINSLETRWFQEMRWFGISQSLAKKRNLNPSGYLIRNDALDLDAEEKAQHFFTAYTRFLFQTAEKGIDNFNDHHGEGQYLTFAHGFDAEITFFDEILTGMGTETSGTGRFGKPKEFGKELAELIDDEEVEIDMSLYLSEKKDLREKKDFALQIVALGRFLHSDMRHEIGTARYLALADEKKSLPSMAELAECCGYASTLEMTDAFLEFIEKDNIK